MSKFAEKRLQELEAEIAELKDRSIQEIVFTNFILTSGWGGGVPCEHMAEKDGIILAIVDVEFGASSSGIRQATVRKNGHSVSSGQSIGATSTGITSNQIVLKTIELISVKKGDRLSAYIKQTSGNDMTISRKA